MVSSEELYHHHNQIENPDHSLLKNYWLAAVVLARVQAQQPFIGSTEVKARTLAEQAFQDAEDAVDRESRIAVFTYPGTVRCFIEGEAKNAVNASHRVAMPCTYKDCH